MQLFVKYKMIYGMKECSHLHWNFCDFVTKVLVVLVIRGSSNEIIVRFHLRTTNERSVADPWTALRRTV